MKTFKFKDLAVTVDLDKHKQIHCAIRYFSLLKPELVCYHYTCYRFSDPGPIFTCRGGCSVIVPSEVPTDLTRWPTDTPMRTVVDDFDVSELNEFKNSLAELQKYVDVKIQEAPNELDMLEKKLSEAIEEVRAQRGNK